MASESIDAYLASLPEEKRVPLQRLREQIQAAVPEAREAIAYGRPAFKLDGRYFLGFGAARENCSFYTGRAPMVAYAAELAGYRLWKGTLNFRPDRPLPTDLVAKLVKVRLAEFRPA